ncbi:MAG: hypothetical protein CAPSK01_000854 [Candidatus Accumulibacter vicinus]|uniref:Uncharacterized protein n=1 Tax=Candidatus Accumulibacter vicinus TaxID=2954382 RepID=A0A084Y3T6_9PROT|nr:MAG: hypothetical protein CAPSK01_000854 [Candidatus Accumulibacter vicinus]
MSKLRQRLTMLTVLAGNICFCSHINSHRTPCQSARNRSQAGYTSEKWLTPHPDRLRSRPAPSAPDLPLTAAASPSPPCWRRWRPSCRPWKPAIPSPHAPSPRRARRWRAALYPVSRCQPTPPMAFSKWSILRCAATRQPVRPGRTHASRRPRSASRSPTSCRRSMARSAPAGSGSTRRPPGSATPR